VAFSGHVLTVRLDDENYRDLLSGEIDIGISFRSGRLVLSRYENQTPQEEEERCSDSEVGSGPSVHSLPRMMSSVSVSDRRESKDSYRKERKDKGKAREEETEWEIPPYHDDPKFEEYRRGAPSDPRLGPLALTEEKSAMFRGMASSVRVGPTTPPPLSVPWGQTRGSKKLESPGMPNFGPPKAPAYTMSGPRASGSGVRSRKSFDSDFAYAQYILRNGCGEEKSLGGGLLNARSLNSLESADLKLSDNELWARLVYMVTHMDKRDPMYFGNRIFSSWQEKPRDLNQWWKQASPSKRFTLFYTNRFGKLSSGQQSEMTARLSEIWGPFRAPTS